MNGSETALHRDNHWLQQRVDGIWRQHFDDAPQGYPISARFGPRAERRFGSIYSRDERCVILVNGLFAHGDLPEYVVDATIAHELAHYVHGYGSGLRKLHYSPHRGGVVDRELDARGLGDLERRASRWRAENWQRFYAHSAADTVARREDRAARDAETWQRFLATPGFRTRAQLRARLHELAVRLGAGEPAFDVDWLSASRQRTGVSFLFHGAGEVRLHGLLADSDVPREVVDFELMYWLASEGGTRDWTTVETRIRAAGLWNRARKAIAWRRKQWPSYRRERHPLRRP